MSKKIGLLLLMLTLVFQLTATYGAKQASAATGSFIFPEESYDINAPRTTSDERVTLEGTISGVNPSSITYSIYQLVNNQVAEKRENLTTNIIASGFNIEVFNLQLFPGLNRITFTGIQGGSQVTSSIYINYHNGPIFFNLEADLDGESFPIKESGSTVVTSSPSHGRSSADITILGNAPNSKEVTIIVNGNSRTYQVNSTNNYSFVASPINLKKGKNEVTLRVSNNNQVIETTRDLVFYNGDAVFYDVTVEDDDGNTGVLGSTSTIATTTSDVAITGKVIVPNKIYDTDGDGVAEPHPDPAGTIDIRYSIPGVTTTPTPVITASIPGTTPAKTDKFFEYEFTIPSTGSTAFNVNYTLTLETVNEEKSIRIAPNDIQWDSASFSFKLTDKDEAYIYEVNYLPGYNSSLSAAQYQAIKGVGLDGKNMYSQPFAVELLVGNDDGLAVDASVYAVTDQSGTTADPSAYKWTVLSQGSLTVTRDINGVETTFHRILIELTLPFEGTQKINFHLSTSAADVVDGSATVSMLVGMYANFDNAYDNMKIEVDTTTANYMESLLEGAGTDELNYFKGKLENYKDASDIRFKPTGSAGGAQTVFFYINNTEIKLKQTSATASFDGGFIIDPDATDNVSNAVAALIPGENIVKFVYQGKQNTYTRTVNIYIIPTNLPVIPVEGTTGVFPYGAEYDTPMTNDPDFPLSGSIYTTRKSEMKIFGTFDFIDLGGPDSSDTDLSNANGAARVITKLDGLNANRNNYILKIESTNLQSPIEWNLNYELQVYDSEKPDVPAVPVYTGGSNGGSGSVPGITVSYDLSTQSFSFILNKQTLNADGSSSVYNFFVYNSGETGPRASYRVEVDPIALPYDLVRPILPNKQTVNQNFIEVIINAPGADTVTVNKVTAEKIKYDADNDGIIDYQNAYRAVVDGLKAGTNKIQFTITNKNDETSDFFNITYSPTNIPGAQLVQEMKTSNKIFGNALTLNFPKGTSLIRRDFNVPDNFKDQVYSNHELLFAIANPEDGVVDRHDFETLPQNFDRILQNFGYRFNNSYPTRFTKASPVYWIDAGMADDLLTPAYDPQTMGIDPYQFPNAKGSYGTDLPMYDERPEERELIASQMGTLTLAFDPNMKDEIGTIITVYRYDAKNKYWDNIGGVVDTKKNTITVPTNQFGYYVVGKMLNSFLDITTHPYARNYMEAMYAKGIMNAAGADEFGANMYVSRAEFARMIVKALQIPLNYELSKPHFDDVSQTINPDALWDFRYVETAAREGIIRGTQPRAFDPTGNLTREEAAVIITRALEIKLDTDPDKIDKALQKQFKDYAGISYYAKASVSAIAKKGYIQGSPVDVNDPKKGYTFEPQSSLLRSDAAIIVGKVLADLKRLPKLN